MWPEPAVGAKSQRTHGVLAFVHIAVSAPIRTNWTQITFFIASNFLLILTGLLVFSAAVPRISYQLLLKNAECTSMWGDSISRCFKTYLIVWFIKCTTRLAAALFLHTLVKRAEAGSLPPSGKWHHQNPGYPRARPCPGPEALLT